MNNDKIIQRLKKKPTMGNGVFIAPGAVVIGDVVLGDNASIWYNVTLRGDVDKIIIGEGTNIQDNSMVHVTLEKFPTEIGSYSSIGHGVMLHGCKIGSNVLVGIGSIILDGAVIGDNSIVAAGSLVPPRKIFPPDSFIMGHPAKAVRAITPEDIEMVKNNVSNYLQYKDIYIINKDLTKSDY